MSTIWGAIRWDFTYRGLGNSASAALTLYEQALLENAPYRNQAPFWFQLTGPNSGIFADTQATFDQEINYAVSAGLKYWAFLRYSGGMGVQQLQGTYGLNYYQASSINNLINWCSILGVSGCGSTGNFTPAVTQIVAEFAQSNYQTVLSGRPLLYIYWTAASFTSNWGGVLSNFAAFVTALRAATIAAGMPTPYIVVMNGLDNTVLTGIGADANSAYDPPGATTPIEAYPTFDTATQAYWASMAALASPMVPIASSGTYNCARVARPPTYELRNPFIGMNSYVVPPTSAQLTAHLSAGVAFIGANPSKCPAGLGLIYSWSEFSECGTPLCPTIGDPTGSRCTAAGAALIGH